MKVLMLTRLFYPHIGGVERHLLKINQELAKKGYDISVITERYDNSIKNTEKVGKASVTRIDYPKKRFLGLILIWINLAKKIDIIRKADIVHIHDVFIWYLPFRLLFPFKKVFMTFHGYPYFPLKKRAIFLQKIAEKLTSGNMCIGDFIKKWYKTAPTIVSYGAVDIKEFKSKKMTSYKYDAVFASRLDDQTGILTYLETAKEIRNKGYEFKLIVLGNGKYRKEADKLAITKGFVNNPHSYINNSKYAFVSRYLAILEAFASKKMVFAVYDNEIKKDYLYMTPYSKWIEIEKDPRKLAEKVIYYINNPEKEKYKIKKAYDWVLKQSWETMANNYIKLWGANKKR